MLRSPENTQHPGKPWAPGLDLSTFGIDLANPDALEWVTQWVVDAMEEWNFDVFRHEIGMSYAHGPMWACATRRSKQVPRRAGAPVKSSTSRVSTVYGMGFARAAQAPLWISVRAVDA